jgi:hypothetical protein
MRIVMGDGSSFVRARATVATRWPALPAGLEGECPSTRRKRLSDIGPNRSRIAHGASNRATR